MRRLSAALVTLLLCSPAMAEESPPCTTSDQTVCLPKADFKRFLDIATERQCLQRDKPVFEIDSITIITDRDGRVFYTGADPKRPFKLHMHWCTYDVDAEGKIDLVAALQTPPTSGFRFRPKAYLGYLPLKLSKGRFNDGIDAGILVDWFFIQEFNLNLAAGFRSVGLGVGLDLTTNFGVLLGYSLGWTAPLHNINASIYFAF